MDKCLQIKIGIVNANTHEDFSELIYLWQGSYFFFSLGHLYLGIAYYNEETLATMIRGKTKFKCDDCVHVFEALDIEWQATAYSTPMSCPKCGSRHTMPKTLFWFVHKGRIGGYGRKQRNKNYKQEIL